MQHHGQISKAFAKLKKPDRNGSALCGSIYKMFIKMQIKDELRLSSRELHRERIPTIYKEKIVYIN